MFSSSLFRPIFDVQRRMEEQLMQLPNVLGVAAGFKESQGVVTDEPSVVVLVQQKKPEAGLAEGARIPKEINGIKTDVYEVGYLQAHQAMPPQRQRLRPVPGGASIGHYKVTAGTLGVLVRDRTTGERLILSNNHVLANSNEALQGDPILQPGATDGGFNPADIVARLERFIPLHYLEGPVNPPQATPDPTPAPAPAPSPPPTNPGTGGNPAPAPTSPTAQQSSGCDIVDALVGLSNLLAAVSGSEKRMQSVSTAQAQAATAAPPMTAQNAPAAGQPVSNIADCALARPVPGIAFNDPIFEIGTIRQSGTPTLGMQVRKFGRTSGLTQGKVTLLNATVNVGYSTGQGARTARFTGQIITEPMSEGGDSGALIVAQDSPLAVGLLFGGSPLATLFTPIDVVLNALNVEFGF